MWFKAIRKICDTNKFCIRLTYFFTLITKRSSHKRNSIIGFFHTSGSQTGHDLPKFDIVGLILTGRWSRIMTGRLMRHVYKEIFLGREF